MNVVYVIMRSTGEYSDRGEYPIRFALTEDEAKAAVELADLQGKTLEPPPYRRRSDYGYQMPDGSWLPEETSFMETPREARFKPRPDAKEIEAQNEQWEAERLAAVKAMNCIDPNGPASYATYSYVDVELIPAIAIEAATAGETA